MKVGKNLKVWYPYCKETVLRGRAEKDGGVCDDGGDDGKAQQQGATDAAKARA
jgi:hypothetical protein